MFFCEGEGARSFTERVDSRDSGVSLPISHLVVEVNGER